MKGPAELEFSLLSRGSFPAASDTLRRQKCGPVNLGLRTLRRDTSQLLPLRYLGIMKQVGDRDYCYPRLLLATHNQHVKIQLYLSFSTALYWSCLTDKGERFCKVLPTSTNIKDRERFRLERQQLNNQHAYFEWKDLKTGFDIEGNLGRQILMEMEGNINEITRRVDSRIARCAGDSFAQCQLWPRYLLSQGNYVNKEKFKLVVNLSKCINHKMIIYIFV